eukprot:9141883-Pyramimonas_sp.AAC.1
MAKRTWQKGPRPGAPPITGGACVAKRRSENKSLLMLSPSRLSSCSGSIKAPSEFSKRVRGSF